MDPRVRFSGEIGGKISQGSKTTSTPRASNTPVFSISPSISTISKNDSEPMDVDDDEEQIVTKNGASGNANRSSSLLDTSTSGDSETLLNRGREIKWIGVWSSLKPKDKNSLYYLLMTQHNEIESIVSDLIRTYNANPQKAVITLLQLFVDISGYKKVAIEKIYDIKTLNAKEVVGRLERDLMESKLKETGAFLFMKDSKFENIIEAIISRFLKRFMGACYEKNILFDDVLLGHLLDFVQKMAFSTSKSIRSTGVIFTLKIITALVNVYQQLVAYVKGTLDENSNATTTFRDLDEKKSVIEGSIEFMYLVFEKNSALPDKTCHLLKIRCAQELIQWINLFPDMFIIKKRCLGPLRKMMIDQSESVRYSAITTCEKLISSPYKKVHDKLKERIELLLKIVSTRFIDISFKVAVKAVNIFTEAITRYSEELTDAYNLSIINLIYHENSALSKAAGKFLVTYLESKDLHGKGLLEELTKAAFLKKEFADRLPFFIESCIEFCEELQNWNLIVTKLMLSDDVEVKRKRVLSMMKESVKYTLTGLCTKSRLTCQESPQPQSEHVAVAKALIPRFNKLVLAFQIDKKCLVELTEILGFIDIDYCISENLNAYYINIIDLFKDLFKTSIDRSLLENICKALSRSPQNLNRAQRIIEEIKSDCVNSLLEHLNQLTPTSDKGVLGSLREMALKTSVFFARFDLTAILKWSDIFQVWDNNHLKVVKHLIVCCKWHLLWSLRQFIQAPSDENNATNVNLYNHCKEFVYGCLDMLKSSDNLAASYLIFETICDLYRQFGEELKRKRQFAHFIIEVNEPEAYEVLVKFMTYHVFAKTTLPLSKRREYLNGVVNMIFLKAVPIECLTFILERYNTHYEKFGEIMDYVLNQLQTNTPALPLLVLHTLVTIYKQILEKRGVLNIDGEDAKALKLLSKKFAATKALKSQYDCLKLVTNAMFFAFQDEKNLPFLFFARYFANVLNDDMKTEGYNTFRKLVPDKERENEIILLFVKDLKPSA